ncbi:MAG: ATP-binding protein, partial [Dehalococcoidia bacterium]|nr:ATP-binding protein [Dehalococcoidia bacterium]
MPPHLAGREDAFAEFERLLRQDVILENMVLTGLRGVGKTVLLDTFKPRAIEEEWLWVGTDLSQTASLTEVNLANRLMTDFSVVTSAYAVPGSARIGFDLGSGEPRDQVSLSYEKLWDLFMRTPGLESDKLKAVLEYAAAILAGHGRDRVIFAYDEAQNLSDHPRKDRFPLSMLLDIFQSLQKKGIRFMLVLTGLPTLMPKLVDARTFAERMFRVVTLDRLNDDHSREAITKPLDVAECPVRFTEASIEIVAEQAGGYPYFIQFFCREVFDVFIQQVASDHQAPIAVGAIQTKLDIDFFSGRWARATDRQQQLLWVIANLENADGEFTILELLEKAKTLLEKGFSASHAGQMLSTLADRGLIYKNRFGKYALAVPLMARFIRRNYDGPTV